MAGWRGGLAPSKANILRRRRKASAGPEAWLFARACHVAGVKRWGFCEIAMYQRLASYVSLNNSHVMTYEDFVRDEDGGLKGLMAQLYPDRPGGRVEILKSRKPSDIVKRSNSQVKKMVAPRADIKSPRRRRAIGANRSFRAGDERGRGRGLVRRVGRAGAAVEDVS